MTNESAAAVVDDGACFVCGPHNPDGLGLTFTRDADGTAHAEVTLGAVYQGYRGIAHGGIVMLLLDEVMAHAAGAAGDKVMTAAVAVRFRAPVPLGIPLALTGRVVSKRGKILKMAGAILDAGGVTLATADGSFMSLGPLDPGHPSNPAAAQTV